jgi:rSAM/selenodomain-associated transferase 1
MGVMRVGADRSSAVVVLAKVPQRGRVKTRLVPTVGEDGATALAEAMLGDTLEALEALAPSVARLWVASGSLEAARARVPAHWIVEPQAEGDLGARMGEAWRVAAAERVVIVGADAPSMSAARVEAALTALGTADVVVGPTLDGGYDLLALRRREAAVLDDMPWSTPELLRVTRARARGAGLVLAELEPGFDVDTGEDLIDLAARLDARAAAAPRTRAWLAALRPGHYPAAS